MCVRRQFLELFIFIVNNNNANYHRQNNFYNTDLFVTLKQTDYFYWVTEMLEASFIFFDR